VADGTSLGAAFKARVEELEAVLATERTRADAKVGGRSGPWGRRALRGGARMSADGGFSHWLAGAGGGVSGADLGAECHQGEAGGRGRGQQGHRRGPEAGGGSPWCPVRLTLRLDPAILCCIQLAALRGVRKTLKKELEEAGVALDRARKEAEEEKGLKDLLHVELDQERKAVAALKKQLEIREKELVEDSQGRCLHPCESCSVAGGGRWLRQWGRRGVRRARRVIELRTC
jgi:hypothetical protein